MRQECKPASHRHERTPTDAEELRAVALGVAQHALGRDVRDGMDLPDYRPNYARAAGPSAMAIPPFGNETR